MSKILKIEKIKKCYGSKNNITKAIDDISFDVDKGEFVAIMGASGSGKTTLLNCISTIDKVTDGKIYLENMYITYLATALCLLFQRSLSDDIFGNNESSFNHPLMF